MSGRSEKAARWMYRGVWSVIVHWFRVPEQPPSLPVKSGEFIAQFPPSENFLRYLKFIFWIVLGLTDIALTIGSLVALIALFIAGLWWLALLLIPIALFIIIVPDIIAFIAIHLRYDTTWYVMTDRSLRIRRGIWIIHETTITFENVQNLKVQQGPLQRHFGIANLVVETAGAGGDSHGKAASSITNKGIVEGVGNAHELRDRILMRMRQSRSAGLGDESPGELAAAQATQQARGAAWTAEQIAALREIRDEVRLLAG
jgi:membrane protein YdbS with pleckstrin-like domain